MKSRHLLSCFSIAGLLLSTSAFAGVKLTIENTAASTSQTRTDTILLDRDRMSMTTGEGRMIFRDDQKTVWVLSDKRHGYVEITPQTMHQAQAAMEQAIKKLQEQMKSMPEDQRKKLEAMMEAELGQTASGQKAAESSVIYRKLGKSMTVRGWSCEMVERLVNGKKQADLCVARLDQVGLTPDDVKVFEDFFIFVRQAMPASHDRTSLIDFEDLRKAVGYAAIPLDVTTYADGKVVSHGVIKAIERSEIPPETFEIPAGYQKETMPKTDGGGAQPQ
jgi:hypothetical protein